LLKKLKNIKRNEMREIKFRAWDENKNEFIDPIYMDGIFYMDEEFRNTCNSVEQFIGLKDKNGKEIYEGDIYLSYGYIVVNGKQKRPKRILIIESNIESWHKAYCLNSADNLEVIGNIHANPERLNNEI
jgi:hypothetical protein